MKIATWNIAGGRKARSSKQFDYSGRDLEYFAEQLRNLEPDVVCIQEMEYAADDNLAKQLAKKIGMPYVFETQMHISHVDPAYGISLAILSREALQQERSVVQPYPSFPLHLPDGSPDKKHIKYLQIARLHGICIGNVQTQPLEFLGTPYGSTLGHSYADELSDFFVSELDRPLVFAGDFCADRHTTHVKTIYDKACSRLQLTDTLPDGQTKPGNSGRPDAIFASPEITVTNSGIVQTETDHFLCWADLSLQITG